MPRKNLDATSPVAILSGNKPLNTKKAREAASLALRTALENGGKHDSKLFTNPVDVRVTKHGKPKEADNGAMVNQSLNLVEAKEGLDPRNGYIIDQYLADVASDMDIRPNRYARMNVDAPGVTVPVIMTNRWSAPYIHYLPLDSSKGKAQVSDTIRNKYKKHMVSK